jgi:serine/threonine protein kinase
LTDRIENILLDWDWTVRLADFGHSTSTDVPECPSLSYRQGESSWPSIDCHYLAPECYDGVFNCESDVFSFGLILFELLSGQLPFPQACTVQQQYRIARTVSVDGVRPAIPDSLPPDAQALIAECWADNAADRPTFAEIVDRSSDVE